jgi:hypothetical protein
VTRARYRSRATRSGWFPRSVREFRHARLSLSLDWPVSSAPSRGSEGRAALGQVYLGAGEAGREHGVADAPPMNGRAGSSGASLAYRWSAHANPARFEDDHASFKRHQVMLRQEGIEEVCKVPGAWSRAWMTTMPG